MHAALGLKHINPTERGEHAGLEEDADIDNVIRERLSVQLLPSLSRVSPSLY